MLQNKTVLITGATQGLGRQIALDLAALDVGTLLLHGRDQARLDRVAGEVGGAVRTYVADLADLDAVRDMAGRVREAEGRLDVLINNAAVGGGPDASRREVSRQGHELRFAVNALAADVLARELVPLLAASAPARVVNVASMGQEAVDFDDPMMERRYDGLSAYCRSKLAMIMMTFELAAELADRKVTVNAVHPAHLMDTRAVREYGLTPEAGVEEGSRPVVRLVTDPELETTTGRYFDRFTEARAHDQAYDPVARGRLAALLS
ncbi:SDR family NAD(P)-dependent oxidoreductase [Spirillospora sp. NPDC048911]|uniref:SDR family NAD(P)-dependent oxidoreductase n=1 Tax=Spirillospora sp. NPDC048911 TaxID=3364527 RepID=UPI003721C8E4